MKSMLQKPVYRQEVPDRRTGIVIGIDVSKGRINFGAYHPEGCSEIYQVNQDLNGYNQLREFIEGFQHSGHEVWVGFEPTGPYSICLREWLLKNNFRTVQVNPYHTKRTKEVRDNSPHKTDNKDPRVIADLIWQGCYLEIPRFTAVYAELRSAAADWKSSNKTRTALRNEFQNLMEVWFPELSRFFFDRVGKSIRAIVRSYPSLEALGQASQEEIYSLLKKAGRGKIKPEKAAKIQKAARESVAWDQGQKMRHRHMCRLLDELEQLENYRLVLKEEMAELLKSLPQTDNLLSVPGVGIITLTTLLGRCGDLKNYESYEQLEKFVGLNLCEVSSGKHTGEYHISKRGCGLARESLFLAAAWQMREGGLYRGYTLLQKAKRQAGKKIQIAIARKLLRLLYTLYCRGIKFDERRFFENRKAGDGRVYLKGVPLKASA